MCSSDLAGINGIATGIGTTHYGAQLIVEAASQDEAIESATAQFQQAAARAGLPEASITRTEAISEEEEEDDA